jgi:hypothetical protein
MNDGGKQVRALHEVWFCTKQGLGSAAVSCGVMIRCFKFVIRGLGLKAMIEGAVLFCFVLFCFVLFLRLLMQS